MILLFLTISFVSSSLFFLAKTPLTMGVLLILHTFAFSIFLGSMMNYFWFFYILILVFIGGMLILFIYATSIFPNEKFSFNQPFFYFLICSTLFFISFTFIMNYFFNLNLISTNLETNLNMWVESPLLTTKIFSSYSSILFFFLVNYLFYCMMIVIKITNFYSGPLRKLS